MKNRQKKAIKKGLTFVLTTVLAVGIASGNVLQLAGAGNVADKTAVSGQQDTVKTEKETKKTPDKKLDTPNSKPGINNDAKKDHEQQGDIDKQKDNSNQKPDNKKDLKDIDSKKNQEKGSDKKNKEGDKKDSEKDKQKDKKALNTVPIIGTKTDNGLKVSVTAPKGSFPEGTQLQITALSKDTATSMVKSVSKNMVAQGFDISFFDKNGNKVQPKNGNTVDVRFTAQSGSSLNQDDKDYQKASDKLAVYHVEGKSSLEKMATFVAPQKGASTQVAVKASGFSPYVVARNLGAPADGKMVDVKITKFEIQNTDHTTAKSLYHTDTFLLMMNWDASSLGSDIHQGDYFDVTLPDAMWFPSDTTKRTFNLTDSNGNVVATAHVNPGPMDAPVEKSMLSLAKV